MRQTKIAKSFGKALLDLAAERGLLELVKEDMALVLSTAVDNKELQVLLNSPVIDEDKKKKIIGEIFKGKVQDVTLLFLNLVAKKGRLNHLIDIAFTFSNLYLEHKNILRTVIKSVDGVSDALKKKVADLVRASYQKEVMIIEEKDPSLIGGFVITVGDKQVDASVSRQLAKLQMAFAERAYTAKI